MGPLSPPSRRTHTHAHTRYRTLSHTHYHTHTHAITQTPHYHTISNTITHYYTRTHLHLGLEHAKERMCGGQLAHLLACLSLVLQEGRAQPAQVTASR